jgi:hypothetical protein
MTVIDAGRTHEAPNVLVRDGLVAAYGRGLPVARHVDYGMLCFDPRAFDHVDTAGEHFDLGIALQALAARSQLAAEEVAQPYDEIGSVAGLRQAARNLAGRASGGRYAGTHLSEMCEVLARTDGEFQQPHVVGGLDPRDGRAGAARRAGGVRASPALR